MFISFLKPSVPPLDQLIACPRDQLIALLLSLLLLLESNSHNPGLPGRTGKSLVLKIKFEFEIYV